MPFAITPRNFKINYEIHGDLNAGADRTIIFSHGNGNCLQDWKSLGYVEKLAPFYRLVLMDALGYGSSDKPHDAKEYSSEQRAADVIAVLDALAIERCHFLGASIGGSLGFALAALYPQRFISFIIGSAHPYGSSKPYANLFDDYFKNLLASGGNQAFVECIETQFLQRKFPAAVRETFLHNDPQAIICANTPQWPDYSACLNKITVPVLLYAGAKDPVAEFLPELKNKIAHCTMNILPDTDHAQAFWEGATIASLAIEFLATVNNK